MIYNLLHVLHACKQTATLIHETMLGVPFVCEETVCHQLHSSDDIMSLNEFHIIFLLKRSVSPHKCYYVKQKCLCSASAIATNILHTLSWRLPTQLDTCLPAVMFRTHAFRGCTDGGFNTSSGRKGESMLVTSH